MFLWFLYSWNYKHRQQSSSCSIGLGDRPRGRLGLRRIRISGGARFPAGSYGRPHYAYWYCGTHFYMKVLQMNADAALYDSFHRFYWLCLFSIYAVCAGSECSRDRRRSIRPSLRIILSCILLLFAAHHFNAHSHPIMWRLWVDVALGGQSTDVDNRIESRYNCLPTNQRLNLWH